MGICGNAIHTINEPMITPSIVSLMLKSLLIAGSIGISDKIPVKIMNRPIERIIIILFLQLENSTAVSGIGYRKGEVVKKVLFPTVHN